MKIKISKRNMLFLVFFLLTIGNGSYFISIFQNKIEFAGLLLMLIATFLGQRKNFNTLKKYFISIFCSIVLSLGAIYYKVSTQSIIMIFLSSFLLMNYSDFSNLFVSENKQIKIIGNALFCGMIFNTIVGSFTGTLGLSFNSNDSILIVLFQCGIKVKNYCGGIWLVTFICYYIYYYRNNSIGKHFLKFFILSILLVFSGSKGACFLALVFVLCINFNKLIKIKEKQANVFYGILSIFVIIISLYIYNDIFINIPTYAYRMRGINKIFDIITHDFNRLLFGFSDIAYADTGFDYTINMRNYLGWESSIEMAYVNIIIKNGFLGYIIYFKVFKNILKKSKQIRKVDKNIVYCILVIMLFSGFTETYISSIHYVVGPALFCLINGIVQDKSCIEKI